MPEPKLEFSDQHTYLIDRSLSRYRRKNLGPDVLEDLKEEAYVALLDALQLWRGQGDFSSYAAGKIRQRMFRYASKQVVPVHIPDRERTIATTTQIHFASEEELLAHPSDSPNPEQALLAKERSGYRVWNRPHC